MVPASSKEFLDIQANCRECRFTLKLIHDMTIMHTHVVVTVKNHENTKKAHLLNKISEINHKLLISYER